MKVAIYSRGVDLDQQQSLNALLAELNRYDTTIYVFEDLLVKFSLVNPPDKSPLIPFNYFSELHNSINCLILSLIHI